MALKALWPAGCSGLCRLLILASSRVFLGSKALGRDSDTHVTRSEKRPLIEVTTTYLLVALLFPRHNLPSCCGYHLPKGPPAFYFSAVPLAGCSRASPRRSARPGGGECLPPDLQRPPARTPHGDPRGAITLPPTVVDDFEGVDPKAV